MFSSFFLILFIVFFAAWVLAWVAFHVAGVLIHILLSRRDHLPGRAFCTGTTDSTTRRYGFRTCPLASECDRSNSVPASRTITLPACLQASDQPAHSPPASAAQWFTAIRG